MASIRTLLALIASLVGLFLAIPIVVVGFPFWAVAWLTNRATRLLEPKVVPWDQLIRFDPTFGWTPKANLNTHCVSDLGGDVFHVTTDSEGWPGVSTIEQSPVMVFGDSFAFGYGVNAEALFSEVNPELHIKAIGAPGYNMVQEVMWMDRLASQLQGKLVVWFIYVGNDLYENLQPNMQDYRTPFVRHAGSTGEWEIVNSHLSSAKWWPYHADDKLRSAERFAAIFGTSFLSERVYSACDFLIKSGSDICARAGASLTIITIPILHQLSLKGWKQRMSDLGYPESLDRNQPDRRIAEICSQYGVRFVAGKDHLNVRHFIPADGHWNEKGHQRISDLIAELYYQPSWPATRNDTDPELRLARAQKPPTSTFLQGQSNGAPID